jgi:hypothetical protein
MGGQVNTTRRVRSNLDLNYIDLKVLYIIMDLLKFQETKSYYMTLLKCANDGDLRQ